MTCTLTYEELSQFAAGDVPPDRAAEIESHVTRCETCRHHLATLKNLDASLNLLPRHQPPATAVLEARRLLSHEIRGTRAPEIMTLDEVAQFLHISLDNLGEIVEELPAFELAGEIRIRRSKLIEWIEQREIAYTRTTAQTQVSRILSRVFVQGVS